MSLYARIANQDVKVIKASMSMKQSEVGEFSFVCAAKDIDRTRLRFKNAALFRRGQQVISGYVSEKPTLELSKDGVLNVNVKCYSELGRLLCYRANTLAHFQEVPVVNIIQQLLTTTPDWVLSDISTMVDAAVVTTVDLRGKESLFAQIAEACKSIPNLFLRYGGFAGGIYNLDIGFFGEDTNYLVQGRATTSLKVNNDSERVFRLVEAYSDKSGDERLTLGSALSYPGIGAHPDWAQFPIVIDDGRYVVINNALTEGCEISKSFSVNKTKNDTPPTAAEVAEAAFAMWQHAVRFLQENAEQDSYSGSAILTALPAISSDVYVDAHIQEDVYDPLTRQETLIETFRVREWLRITAIKCDFDTAVELPDDTYGDEYDLEITSGAYQKAYTDVEQLHDHLEHHGTADKNSGAIGNGIKSITLVDVTHTTIEPADAACLPTVAKEYSFPLGTIPAGATQVFGIILNKTPANANADITQYPALPATPMKACVDVGGTWPGPSDVTVRVAYLFL